MAMCPGCHSVTKLLSSKIALVVCKVIESRNINIIIIILLLIVLSYLFKHTHLFDLVLLTC